MCEENNVNKSEQKHFGFTKRWLVLFSLVAMLCATVGGTLAFLMTKTDQITNVFEIGNITYTLNLVANPPDGHNESEIAMPTVSPGNSQTVASSSAVFNLDKAPTLANYKFNGWYVGATGNLSLYGPDDRAITVGYKAPYTETTGNTVSLTLYAHWVPSTEYQITYNSNADDAKFINNTGIYIDNKTHDLSYTILTPTELKVDRGDYWVWTEWNTKPDGTGVTYLGGDIYTKNENLTLYAIWAPKTAVQFGTPEFVNMQNTNVVTGTSPYNFTVECETQGGADGIAIPIYNLIPNQAYRLTFSVSFNDFDFYEEDSRSYIFGTNVIDSYENYHTEKSILEQVGKNVTSRYENMMWSTEEDGTFNVFLEFVPNKETMYWFWETTDVVDKQKMSYVFNNFNIQMLDTPKPRVEFEDLTVKFAQAPYINTPKTANDSVTEVTKPINTGTNNYGTRWVDYKNVQGNELTARHKNYFHTEYYGLDYLQYRVWGYAGHEVMTIPISGLEVGKTYKLSFEQDLTDAIVYNTNTANLNTNQLYGCAVTEEKDMLADYNKTGTVDKHSTYKDLRKAAVGTVSDQEIIFTATAENMYWQWTLGDLMDGGSAGWKYSVVKLSDVTISETNAPASLALAPLMELPENVIMGEELILTEMPDMKELEKLLVLEDSEFYGWLLTGGLSSQVIAHEDLEDTLTAIFELAAEYDEEVMLSLIPLYVKPELATALNVTLKLTNITAEEQAELEVGTDYKLLFMPNDGYVLEDEIVVKIDGTAYTVLVSGLESGENSGEDSTIVPTFDPDTNILTIPGELITDETAEISIIAMAVEVVKPSEMEKATETNATENSETTGSDETGSGEGNGTDNVGNDEITDGSGSENAGDTESEGTVDSEDAGELGSEGANDSEGNGESGSEGDDASEGTVEPGAVGTDEVGGDDNSEGTGESDFEGSDNSDGTGELDSAGTDEVEGTGESESEGNNDSEEPKNPVVDQPVAGEIGKSGEDESGEGEDTETNATNESEPESYTVGSDSNADDAGSAGSN